jgi:hypothetical protein
MQNRLIAAVCVASLAMIGCGGGGSEPTKLTEEEKARQMEALKQQRSDEWKSTLKKK